MPAEGDQPETAPLVLRAGQILLADWRGDTLPKEPNKRRPAVVVEDDGLFAPSYLNAILVPLTEDAALVIPDMSVVIAPTAENRCSKACWAVSHLVATTAKARLRATQSRIARSSLPPFAARSPSPSAPRRNSRDHVPRVLRIRSSCPHRIASDRTRPSPGTR